MAVIPFVGQAYNLSPSVQLDNQNCINWYLTADPYGKSQNALLPRPALKVFSPDNSEYCNRGALSINDVLYVVIDNKFYLCDRNGNRKEKGTLKTATGLVSLMANDNQIFISDGRYGYVYQIYKNEFHEAEEFFVITAASSLVGEPTFSGTGLNDMTTLGEYSGEVNREYRVVIDSIGTPDTFKWSQDNGETFVEEKIQITGSAQLLNNGVQVEFVHTTGHTGNDYWNFEATSDSGFYVPVKPTYDDNRGIYIRRSSNNWGISEINQFDRVNALAFAEASYIPDDLVTALTMKEEIWLIGMLTAEPWFDVGNVPFPYERRKSLVQNYGCIATFSSVVTHDFIGVWLSQNREGMRMVVALSGYEIQIISTEAINNEFRKYEVVEDAIGSTFQWNGHIFYVLTFPTADRTWAYDFTTKAWCEFRCTLDNELPSGNPKRQGRFKANWFAQFADKIVCGDFESGAIYELSDDVYTDNGEMIIFERTAPHFNDKNNLSRVEVNCVEIDCEKGKGTVTGQGEIPSYMLQISHDGGYTWGNEKWKNLGKSGEYKKRLRWNNLGTARNWLFKLRVTDPAYRTIYSAIAYIGQEVVE